MMGVSHALTGLVAGCSIASLFVPHRPHFEYLNELPSPWWLILAVPLAAALAVLLPGLVLPDAIVPNAPWPVLALLVAVTGGSALLPDLDHPSSTAARSIGFVTRFIARRLDRLGLVIYHATRGPRDPAGRKGGHRLITHTVPGCVTLGLVSLLLVNLPAIPLTLGTDPDSPTVPLTLITTPVTLALLVGLLAAGLPKVGTGFSLTGAGVALYVTLVHPSWSWLYAVGVTVGCIAHVLGDTVTNSGTPLAWPIMRDGRRWRLIRTPKTFDTGGSCELRLVRPLTLVTLGVTLGMVTGVIPATLTLGVTA